MDLDICNGKVNFRWLDMDICIAQQMTNYVSWWVGGAKMASQRICTIYLIGQSITPFISVWINQKNIY